MIIEMEKIKASEVLDIIKKNYRFLCVDTDGGVSISTHLPEPWIDKDGIIWLSSDEHDSIFSIPTIDTRAKISKEESLSSVREIDFSEEAQEPKTLQDLEPESITIVPVSNIIAAESMLQGTPVFKDIDGKLTPAFPPTKEPKSIFKLDDTVHVLSCSNVGEFGKSTEGIIKTIYKDGTVLVKVDEGVEEVHNEDNVSFTPFSIKEAGFSQVRPVPEPKIGDWGFFHDDKKPDWLIYGKLGIIKDISVDCRYRHGNGSHWRYFSIEPPQLAEGIPNPFTKC